MRWLWIDRFLKFDSRKSARAVKTLSRAEDFFADHYPGYPVIPASVILEGVAQTGGILVGEANNFQEKVILAKIVSARFDREVLAGEQLVYDVELLHLRPEGASVGGKIFAVPPGAPVADVLDGPVAQAELFFAHLDRSRSQQVFGERNFVFGGELKQMLGLAKMLATHEN